MDLTDHKANVMDTIAVEVTEFAEMCVSSEECLESLDKKVLLTSIFIQCIEDINR